LAKSIVLARPNDPKFRTPAYAWIRAADKLPPTGSDATVAKVKLFDPTGSWTWYIAEFDPDTGEAFGLVDGFAKELGYFNLNELAAIKGRFGLPIERDLYFTPTKLEDLT
jgi:hypothetical protein